MDLRNIITNRRRERVFTEATIFGGIICPLIKMNNWDVYIYGGGNDIADVVLYLWGLEIEVKGIFDVDAEKSGEKVLTKVPYIYPDTQENRFDSEKTFVIINTIYFKQIEQYEIMKILNNMGITMFYAIDDGERLDIKVQQAKAFSNRIQFYTDHVDDLEVTYDMLYDKKSKEIMIEFIRTYMEISSYRLIQGSSNVKYFFGYNEDGTKEELYTHLKDEIWINCGSCLGDNIFWYFANGLAAKAVYAYEGDEKNYKSLVKNIHYLPDEHRNKVCCINEYIDKRSSWEILEKAGGKVTFINADIEGGELDLLKSMRNIIAKYRPVLAICVYHKASDLIEIPQYIKEIDDSYCYILRKYEAHVGDVRRVGELVLYAVPEERVRVAN